MTANNEVPFGIDFGTTNTCGSVWWNERAEVVANEKSCRSTPSYYYFDGVESLVGIAAKDKIGTNPKNVFYDVKRLLTRKSKDPLIQTFKNEWTFDIKENGYNKNFCEYIVNETYEPLSPVSISAEIMKYMEKCVKKQFGPNQYKVVITIPVYFTFEQKNAIYEAAKLANLNVLNFLAETTAVAIAYSKNCRKVENIFIIDVAGGSFSIAIIKINGQHHKTLAATGSEEVGGRDFDHIIFDWIKNKLEEKGFDVDKMNQKKKFKMMVQAQAVKEALSVSQETPVILSDIFESAKSQTLTRNEFEAMSKHLIQKIESKCQAVLESANMKPADIDHILFVGGSSRMPMIAKMLKNIFGDENKFLKVVNPDYVVAFGAAMYAAACIKASKKPEIVNLKFVEVLAMSIGVEITGGRFKPVLLANTEVPCENSFELTTSEDNQRSALIPIYEGLSEKIEENKWIAEITIPELPPGKAGTIKANVKLSLQLSGMLTAVATVKGVAIDISIQYNTPWEIK